MHFQALLIAAVSATAIAQDLASGSSEVTISFDLEPVESSVFSVLATGVPSSVLADLGGSSLASEFSAGNFPSWYSALPSGVKSFINSVDAATSDTSLASTESSSSAAVSSVSSSADSQSSAASASASSSASTTLAPASTSESDAASSTSSSTAGASAPTGAVVASMAGVFGVLALAVGL